jgi:hypothetical protein
LPANRGRGHLRRLPRAWEKRSRFTLGGDERSEHLFGVGPKFGVPEMAVEPYADVVEESKA